MNNIVKFKPRKYPAKKPDKLLLDDFENFVKDVRKKKLHAFYALVWLDDEVFLYDAYNPPINYYDILGALEIFKAQTISNLLED